MPTERRPSPTLLAASLVGVLGGALVAVPEVALAQQGRPSTLAMTCGQARNFLAARRAAVLGTGGYTYDRYVRDRSFCEPTEITKNAVVPTRDTPECLVGYRCIEPGRNWFDDE